MAFASLHYPLGSQKQDEFFEPKEPILQGNSRRCTADRERIRTGERSHRQPPEIVWTNQGDYLTAMDDIEMEEGTSGVPRAPGAPVYGVEPTGDTESESSEESRSQIT